MVLLYYFLHKMTDRDTLEVGNKRWSIRESTWCAQQRLKFKNFPVIQAEFTQSSVMIKHLGGQELRPG